MRIELARADEIVMKIPAQRDGLVRRPVALVDNVVVRAAHRGRGIGTQLMSHAEAWAHEHGAIATELHVWSFNEAARRLYERLGYATRSVRMERVLPPPDGGARAAT
ncbi:MAG: GNAT family N-acetyltransferase [Labilithrix sp.]|nr:GNAT family N-acetyltransferase [Labilithrix sp.]